MRATGEVTRLDSVGQGDHVCWVVDSATEYDALTRACLESGQAAGDKTFVFGPSDSELPLVDGATTADPRVDFLGSGALAPETMFAMFRDQAALARDEGFRGLRVVADMTWVLPQAPSRDALASFELRLDEVVREVGATVVCAYRRPAFDEADIGLLDAVHPSRFGDLKEPLGFRMWNLDHAHWCVTGEVDHSNAAEFATALAAAAVAAKDATMHLHLGDLTFIDLAGLRAIGHAARPDGSCVRLHSAPATMRKCWQLLDYGTHFPAVGFAQ